MKNTLYILFVIALFTSCDSGEDMFKDSNQAPLLSIKGSRHAEFGKYQLDSLKLIDIYYKLDYKIEDEESLEIDVKVDSIFRFEFKKNSLVFGAIKAGSSNIYITVTDSWGKKDKITFNLTCFKNLLPIASLEITPLSGTREFKLDSSVSYDKDAKYGGKINMYRFYVNGKEIDKTYHPYINFTFPKIGEYKIGVQVKDNNDEWSELVQETITIN